MSLPVWGNLEKSQVDPEKIEEAIARLIQAHEDDPNAHVETGESLQSHKAAEIIDHLISSIIADKYSDKQKLYTTGFDSVDSFTTTGANVTLDWPGANLQTGNVINQVAYVRSTPAALELLDFTKNPFFQAIIYQNNIEDVISQWWWGADIGDETSLAFGFRTNNGILEAVILIGNVLYNETIAGVNITGLNIYRAILDSSQKQVKFYVNGVLKQTITYTESPTPKPYAANIYVKNLVAENRQVVCRHIMLAHD